MFNQHPAHLLQAFSKPHLHLLLQGIIKTNALPWYFVLPQIEFVFLGSVEKSWNIDL